MAQETRVLYNETCPVCSIEIKAYQRLALKTAAPLRFDSLDQAAAFGLSADQAARRLHVLHKGQVVAGIPAFQILWAQLPRWRWLARLTALPLIHPVLCLIYDRVLAPLLYRAHLRRARKAKA